MRVCVYAASSDHCSPEFHADAHALGRILAQQGATVVYGGGSRGSMGAVANGALEAGGEVIGILPRFMADLEWGHSGLTRLELVEDMRERKHRLLAGSDAVVVLPGGCGTLEELFEAITLKRLGLYFKPIVLLNTLGYWQPLLDFMQAQVIGQQFMNAEHAAMWSLAKTPEQVPAVIEHAPAWGENAREFAAVRG